jgi:hypothetical protein
LTYQLQLQLISREESQDFHCRPTGQEDCIDAEASAGTRRKCNSSRGDEHYIKADGIGACASGHNNVCNCAHDCECGAEARE